MGAIFGAWQLGYVVFAVPCGALLDRVGLHIALFACALIMALSGFLRAMAGSELSLFLAVAIFGIGAPLISVGGPKLIATWFDSKERGLAMGIFSTGPPLGGILAFSLTNSTFMPLADGNWRLVVLGYSLFVLAIAAVWLMIGANRFSRPLEQQIAADPKQSQLDVIRHLLQIPAVRIILLMSAGIFFFNQALNNWLPEILRSGGMDVVTAGYWASIPTSIRHCCITHCAAFRYVVAAIHHSVYCVSVRWFGDSSYWLFSPSNRPYGWSRPSRDCARSDAADTCARADRNARSRSTQCRIGWRDVFLDCRDRWRTWINSRRAAVRCDRWIFGGT